MTWSTARIFQKLSSHRIQRQSSASTSPKGSTGQRPGRIGLFESESGLELNTDGFPSASKGLQVEHLFSQWLKDRNSIHGTWQRFFGDLVENKATPSRNSTPIEKTDSNVTSGPGESLPQPPKMGSVLPARGLMSKKSKEMTRGMSQEKTPREPEKPAKGNLNVSLRRTRRAPRYWLHYKFAKFRRQATLRRAPQIPGSKSSLKRRSKARSRKRLRFATFNFKSYYEEQRNREKSKQAKLRRGGVQDISKENKLITKPETIGYQEKPQPGQDLARKSHIDKDNYTLNYSEEDPSPNPKSRTYESLEALIDDLDNATINMAWTDPTHQERVKRVQLWSDSEALNLGKVPSEEISLRDQPEKSSQNEDKALICQDKAQGTGNPSTKSTETLPFPLGNVSEKSTTKKPPSSNPSSDP